VEGQEEPLMRGSNVDQITAKQKILQLVQDQPEDSSYDEIMRELAFARMIERGLEDAENGRTISHEEMQTRISSWTR
jgi:predicted transcriptional regulator